MYKKIYIHAPGLEKPEEFGMFSYLLNKHDPYKIWEYSMKVGKNYKGVIYDVGVFELFLFHSELCAQGYSDSQIEFIFDQPLFLHNDELYMIQNGVRSHIETDQVGFFSLRPNSWRHPFFFLLQKIIEKKGGKMKRTNSLKNEITGKGKFYGLQNLIQEREQYIGNIVVPFGIGEGAQFEIFYDYLLQHFSNRIVAKKDFGCAGKTVFVMDLKKNDDPKQKERLIQSLKGHVGLNTGVYLTEYYDFEEEYRFYFNKRNGKITLHSMKTKKILSDFEHIVSCETFQYYKNIQLKWQYVTNDEWQKYQDVVDRAYNYLEKLDYTTGTLEFGRTKDGKFVFFEVNSMSATLCFGGEDTINMQGYYDQIFQELLFDK